jgi:hypothetical protein
VIDLNAPETRDLLVKHIGQVLEAVEGLRTEYSYKLDHADLFSRAWLYNLLSTLKSPAPIEQNELPFEKGLG